MYIEVYIWRKKTLSSVQVYKVLDKDMHVYI